MSKKAFLYYLSEWSDVDYETDEHYVAHGSDGVVTYVLKDGQENIMENHENNDRDSKGDD